MPGHQVNGKLKKAVQIGTARDQICQFTDVKQKIEITGIFFLHEIVQLPY
jgi:hypothetical protein